MICLIALIIFSILGIFSFSYRKLAKEAFDCVFRRITFRPCRTGFKEKIKAKIIAILLQKHKGIAWFANRYFEILSWVFVLLFFASLAFSAKSIYNLARYRTCNPQHPQNCIFTPLQKDQCRCQKGKVVCPDSSHNTCKGQECSQK